MPGTVYTDGTQMELLIFDDQVVDPYNFLRDVLARGKSNPLLTSFITKVGAALREDISHLSEPDRKSIPNFSTVLELAERYHGSCNVNTALDSALLCITQLAHYIGYAL